jgi:hypothetical protein
MVTRARSAGVARSSRGNHASGTPRVRPSDNSTQKLSSSKRTLVAFTEEFIPCSFYIRATIFNDLDQLAQNSGIETIILDHGHFRPKPEL